jgi:uncharacterized protein involved in response to NO
MALWLAVYRFDFQLEGNGLAFQYWHAHEMIFGYALAVVAGFLLTAAQNWTGVETLHGRSLAGLFLLWLIARILWIQGTAWLPYAGIADISFILILTAAIAQPVLKVRQSRQAPVLLILALLTAASICFYVGALSGDIQWVIASLYAAMYLVLGLILFMGRRVIPFFAERGVGYPVELSNRRWNDLATWLLFPAFIVAEIFFRQSPAGAIIAAALFMLNSIRIAGWYTPGIWQKPLLWSLYLSYLMITVGFGLHALQLFSAISSLIPVHAFAVGGVGLVTISMMPRVSLGHTGRSVHEAPATTVVFISLLALGAVIRVFLCWLDPSRYTLWITLSGLLWIVAFSLFAVTIGPMLWKQRIDAK